MSVIRYKGQDYAGFPDDVSDSEINYESGDELDPSEPSEVSQLTNTETTKTFAQKVSTAVRNIRYLLKMLGTADISTIGDGTVTGAVESLKSNMTKVKGNAETEYRSGDVNLTAENIGALSLSGGTVDGNVGITGYITPMKGILMSDNKGIYGTNGVVIFARITITSTQVNYPIVFELGSRRQTVLSTATVLFDSTDNYDPPLISFKKYGHENKKIYIKKKETSVWELAMPKDASWTTIDLFSVKGIPISTNLVQIVYPNEQPSNFVESEWTEAEWGGKIKEAVVADHLDSLVSTHSTDKLDLGVNYIGYHIDNSDLDNIFGVGDGAFYRQLYNVGTHHQIYGDYKTGQIATSSKYHNSIKPWRKVVDHLNFRDLIPEASTSQSGLMSAADKTKLDNTIVKIKTAKQPIGIDGVTYDFGTNSNFAYKITYAFIADGTTYISCGTAYCIINSAGNIGFQVIRDDPENTVNDAKINLSMDGTVLKFKPNRWGGMLCYTIKLIGH